MFARTVPVSLASMLLVLAIVLTGKASADNGTAAPAPRTPADEFAGGSPELKFTRYSNEQIQLAIQDKLKIACKEDRCRLFSVSNHNSAFVVEFSTGYGNPNAGNTGSGGVVVVGTTPYNPVPQPYVGLTLRYVNGQCTEDVMVPESLYIAMNTYLYHLMSEDGSTRANLSPAEQTMIMLYTTIMSQAKSCQTVTTK